MEIILLDENRFDAFAINHPNANFYQSSNYGKLMMKHGHNSYYLGLVDDQNNIKAATLMVVKTDKDNSRKKMGYAPRGFLIDWNDDELVKTFTLKIKEYLSKRNFVNLKLDPMVIYKTHDYKGNEISSFDDNIGFVSKLQSMGYIHMGYNNGNEAMQPRWNALTVLDKNVVSMYNSISKEARSKINEAIKSGCKVYKGTSNDINLLYTIIDQKNPPLEYYLDYYQFYGQNNNFELYFTKLEPIVFVNSSKTSYEKEEERNNILNSQIQGYNVPNKDQLMNQKMESDALLAKYKKDMNDASALFQKYPSGLVIAATAIIKHGTNIVFFADGVSESFKDHYPEYLLKWQLMENFAMQGYKIVDFNGTTNDFSPTNIDTYKHELANKIVEYVGEFDLVINKRAYYTESKINPIISWLNTPI